MMMMMMVMMAVIVMVQKIAMAMTIGRNSPSCTPSAA